MASYSIIVRDKHTKEVLPGVTIASESHRFVATTDSIGRVVIPATIVSSQETFKLSTVGYFPQVVQFNLSAAEIVIDLERDVSLLKAVVVANSHALRKVREIQMGSHQVTATEARLLPSLLGEVDILKVFQLKPGVKNAL